MPENSKIISRKSQAADTCGSDEAQARSEGALAECVYLYRNRKFRFRAGEGREGSWEGGGVPIPPGGR